MISEMVIKKNISTKIFFMRLDTFSFLSNIINLLPLIKGLQRSLSRRRGLEEEGGGDEVGLLGGGDFGGADGGGSAFGATGIEQHASRGEVADESWG